MHGNGETALISFRLGAIYLHTRHYGHAALVIASLERLLGYKQDLHIDATPMVEVQLPELKSYDVVLVRYEH